MRKAVSLILVGVLSMKTQALAQDRGGPTSHINGFSPPKSDRLPHHGYWSTPEGKQAAAEIRYQQAQQAFDRSYGQDAGPQVDAARAQYQHLMVLYTGAMANFGINTGHVHPPFPIIVDRALPITDDQLKEDYGVVLKDYFNGIGLFGLGLAQRPPKPPAPPPVENKQDREYIAYAKALQIDDVLAAKFSDQVYAAAVRSRMTPPPFPLQDNRPARQEQQWCLLQALGLNDLVPC